MPEGGGMVGGYGGDRESFAKERGRGELVDPAGPVSSQDGAWSRLAEDGQKITRKLAERSRQPWEWNHQRGPQPAATAKPEEARVAGITEQQAAGEYQRWSKTFAALGLKPIFAPDAGVLVFINRDLTGRALAKQLRLMAAGFTKRAQVIEDEAERTQVTAAEDEAADFG